MPTSMPTFNQPVPGQGIPPAQPTYPVASVNPGVPGAPSGPTKFGGFMGGYQSVLNAANQEQQMRRGTKDWNDQQAANKASGQASGLPPPGTQTQSGNGAQDFLHGLVNSDAGKAVMAGVHAIGNYFSGGAGPAQAAAATPPQGPPAPAAAIPMQGPPAPDQPTPQMNGGVVPQVGVEPSFMRDQPQPTMVAGYEKGGPIGNVPMGFGVSVANTAGIPGFEDGGAIPAQADQSAPAPAPQDQGPPAPPMQAAMPNPAGDVHSAFNDAVEQLHQGFLDHTLDDNGVPSKDQGVPSDANVTGPADQGPPKPGQAPSPAAIPAPQQQAAATAQAVQSVASNPAAQQGQAEVSPSEQGKPHSIPHEQWQKWDENIDHAVALAAQSGRDPGQVRAALEANRNAWVQGHVLRNLSAANVSLLNGDQKGVETALKNAYYYMPDGRDMDISKGADGKLQYQDPISPYVNDQGQTSTSPGKGFKANMVPVDAAHIQMLGQAMLDPMTVQDTIAATRGAAAKMQLERSEAEAKVTTANAAMNTSGANQLKSIALKLRADTNAGNAPSERYLHLAEAEKALAGSSYLKWRMAQTGKALKLDPTELHGMDEASKAYDEAALGEKKTAPLMIPNPKRPGEMMPNDPSIAGKTIHDNTKVPAALAKFSPEQHLAARARSADIYAANAKDGMTPAQAANLSIQWASGGNHVIPAGKPGAGGKADNVMIDEGKKIGHVWSGDHWTNFKLTPAGLANANQSEVSPDDIAGAVIAQSSGGSGVPAQTPDADDNTPDYTNN